MKRTGKCMFIPLAILMILTACEIQSVVTEIPPDSNNRFNGINADRIDIITDNETGCKYIFVESGQGNYKTTAFATLMKNPKEVDCD